TIVAPGRRSPRASASSMIPRAARSFTEPPGFMNSALPKISQPVQFGHTPQTQEWRTADVAFHSKIGPRAEAAPATTLYGRSHVSCQMRADVGLGCHRATAGAAGRFGCGV